jgi:transcriptional regulator with XRE-family HTH domain
LLTGAQIRAARGLLDLTIAELAQLAGLAVNTIRRAEADDGSGSITFANMKVLRMALEDAGVRFIDPDELGPGVRLKNPAPPSPKSGTGGPR